MEILVKIKVGLFICNIMDAGKSSFFRKIAHKAFTKGQKAVKK